ncbi:MAG: MATE family efflux transporter [Chitinispirillales bacterium]|jgi:putative MATE family efflux protein|nr:MATE family efflux transporter [Chitinispirillales bacterium]
MQEIHGHKVTIRHFIKEMLPLAIPVAMHEFLISAVNIADTIMVGQINETAIAAVNLANQIFFIFILMMVGVTSGCAIFVSQYWGDKDVKGVQRTLGFTLILTIIASTIFSMFSIAFAEQIVSFYTKDAAVISLGVDYLKINGYSFPLVALSFTYCVVLRSTHKPKLPLFTTTFALITNVFLNFVFIFGKFGFPRMGVEGAALATLISRTLEVALLFSVMRIKNSFLLAGIKDLFTLSQGFIKKFVATNYPVFLNEMGWVIGTSLFNKIYAGISTQAITSVCIADNIFNIFFVVFFGTSSATAILIGNKIGENKLSIAHDYAKIVHKIIPVISVVFAVLLAAGNKLFPIIYGVESETLEITSLVILVYAFILPFKTFNLHTVNGILRSGGDTKFALALDIGGIWFVGLPMALLARDVLHLPLIGVVIFLLSEEIIKTVIGFFRVRHGKWINRVIE